MNINEIILLMIGLCIGAAIGLIPYIFTLGRRPPETTETDERGWTDKDWTDARREWGVPDVATRASSPRARSIDSDPYEVEIEYGSDLHQYGPTRT